jgi:hypothetical protein
MGTATVTDRERADAIYASQEIARDHERLEKAWDDIVIAAMELEFIERPGA